MPSKFYTSFIPIYGYMVSGVRIQLPGASVLTPHMKLDLTNAKVGLRPVGAIGAIGAYAPEGMWNAEGWSRCALSL
jgi:hypothetical protein